jgi:sugar/nucleoside kinase (ribokinase family)
MTKKIPLICVSSVAGGALLVTRRGSWFGRIPKIQVRSTVGAGDSMVGAMSAYLWKEWIRTRQSMNELAMNNLSMNELAHNLDSEFPLALLRSGLAAACGTLSLPGTLLSTEKAYQKYLPKIVCRSLSKT